MKITATLFLFLFSFLSLDAQENVDNILDDTSSKRNKIIGLSLHTGPYILDADVLGGGIGLGARLHFPVNSTMSLRLNYFSSAVIGISEQPFFHSTIVSADQVGGGLVETFYSPYQNNTQGWFPSYNFIQSTFEVEGLMSLSKIVFKQLNSKIVLIDFYVLGSFGLFAHQTKLDLLDENGAAYPNLITNSKWTPSKFDTKDGRNEIRENLTKIYDGVYETEIPTFKRNKTYSYGGGLRFNLSRSIGLGLEYKHIKYHDFDYADGIRFLSSNQLTRNTDTGKYLNLSLEVKL